MGYLESRDFYVSYSGKFHLDRWESYAARWLYLDKRGKKRATRLDPSPTTIKKAADGIVDRRETRLDYHQMFQTLNRAIENAQAEIAERHQIREEESGWGIQLDNSLAVSLLDISVVRLLKGAGLHGRVAVGRTSDEVLLGIFGIDRVRLTHVRKICPKVPIVPPCGRNAKERQAILAGQGTLF